MVADAMVTNLARDHHLPIVERAALANILHELALGQSGALDDASAAQVGKLAGARLGGRCAKNEIVSGARFPAWGIKRGIGYPCIVKPVGSGSSVGVTLVTDAQDLRAAVTHAQAEDPSGRCMVEEFVRFREVTAPVLRRAGALGTLPLAAIIPPGVVYDYEAKYPSAATPHRCPAAGPRGASATRSSTNSVHEIGASPDRPRAEYGSKPAAFVAAATTTARIPSAVETLPGRGPSLPAGTTTPIPRKINCAVNAPSMFVAPREGIPIASIEITVGFLSGSAAA